MEIPSIARKPDSSNELDYDIQKEKKLFIETKAGIKGLVDSGITKIPRFFINTRDENCHESVDSSGVNLQIPVIDLKGFQSEGRAKIVTEILKASETWGFFYVVNHGVPPHVMEKMLASAGRFHEQPKDVKSELYSNYSTQKVRYFSNMNLIKTKVASWRDSFSCNFEDCIVDSQAIPLVCRDAVRDYVTCIVKLKKMLSEILSEALRLNSDHLAQMECMDSLRLDCTYYPVCPEPDLIYGIPPHSDPYFLTIILQDEVGGLQILHQDRWVNVPPIPSTLVANIGDLMQIVTNDKFKSVGHRVVAGMVRPRVSAACFFYPSSKNNLKHYGPMKELVSEDDPPVYRQINVSDYFSCYMSRNVEGISALPDFKL